MWVKKKTAGVSSSGHEWSGDGDSVWVPDDVGLELVTHHGHEFSEDNDRDNPDGSERRPPEEAKEDRAAREVTEAARAHYQATEGVGTTRLADGRLAQTDTKSGSYAPEVRDTGNEEMGPANVNRTAGHPGATLTPGSVENKADLEGYVAEDPRGRAELESDNDPRKPLSARVGDAKSTTLDRDDKSEQDKQSKSALNRPTTSTPESKTGK